MRIEKTVTAISWIPSEAIEGLPKVPFELGIGHYDEPPPDRLSPEDLPRLRDEDRFREANHLKGWVEVENGRIVGHGQAGEAFVGSTTFKLGAKDVIFAGVAYDTLRSEPEVTDEAVRFVQTVCGRAGFPAPRRVRGKPFFRINGATAWTTLALTIRADGSAEYELVVVTAAESELERRLSREIMQGGAAPERKRLEAGETLVEQGEQGDELYLLLDGVFAVEIDAEQVAEVGPGALVGERALLEGGTRKATLRAATPARVVVVPGDAVDRAALEELAKDRR